MSPISMKGSTSSRRAVAPKDGSFIGTIISIALVISIGFILFKLLL